LERGARRAANWTGARGAYKIVAANRGG
jgi:hypothetical protein